MQNVNRTSYSVPLGDSGICKVRILPAYTPNSLPVGVATSLVGGRMYWEVSLGMRRNGENGGTLLLAGSAQADWDSLLAPAALVYESEDDEGASIHRSNGAIRQILAPQAFVDVLSVTSGPTLLYYELRFYHPTASVPHPTNDDKFPRSLAAGVDAVNSAFVIYRIEPGASQGDWTKKILITKTIRDLPTPTSQVATPTRVETTYLRRKGTGAADYVWSVRDWALNGTAESAIPEALTSNSAYTATGHTEKIVLQKAAAVATDLPVGESSVTYTDIAGWRAPATVTSGSTSVPPSYSGLPPRYFDGPVTETATYYTDDGSAPPTTTAADRKGKYRFPRTKVSTGGAWEAYEYHDSTDRKKMGTVQYVYRPWMDLPATPPATFDPLTFSGMVTKTDYATDAFGMLTRPKLVETRINGTLVSKSVTTYDDSVSLNGMKVLAATTKVYPKPGVTTDYVQSVQKNYLENEFDSFFRGQPLATIRADGTQTSFVRQRGDWSATNKTFTPNTSGKSGRFVQVHGLAVAATGTYLYSSYSGYEFDYVHLVNGQSTLELSILDDRANLVRTEQKVWNGTNNTWVDLAWTDYTYNTRHQLVSRVSSNGDRYEAGYVGEYLRWERDGAGVCTVYEIDALGRRLSATKTSPATPAAADPTTEPARLTTTYAYDAADRVLSETLTGAGSSESIVSSRTYDLVGRVSSENSPNATADTQYAYAPDLRLTTVTLPGGGTRIEETYRDGQPRSVTGTAVVPEFYVYGVSSTDGYRVTWGSSEALASPPATDPTSATLRWTKTVADGLGRTVSTTRPGAPSGVAPATTRHGVFTETQVYETGAPSRGRLLRIERPAVTPRLANTLYVYDAFGQLYRTGQDIDNDGQLTPASTDRFTDTDKRYVNENSAWWLKTTSTGYETSGSPTPTALGHTLVRTTGFPDPYDNPTATLRSETKAVDAEGNSASTLVNVDRANRTVTTTTQAPGLANPRVDTVVNGFATQSVTPDLLTLKTTYDSLGRVDKTYDPTPAVPATATAPVRYSETTYVLGATSVHTVISPRLSSTDVAGMDFVTVATYTYDGAGRVTTVKNADNKETFTRYNLRGQVTHTWGSATIPSRVTYNAFGERIRLHTYRDDSALATPTTDDDWPAPATPPATELPETPSVTNWEFDPPSGLLRTKSDALGAVVRYSYDFYGRAATRQWARSVPGQTGTPLTTTYVYNDSTGDLYTTSYNDQTTANPTTTITRTYTRTGRPLTIIDGAGTRTFTYDSATPWRLSAETLPASFGGLVLTPRYETATATNLAGGFATLKGRARGWSLGTATRPDSVLDQTRLHDPLGRIARVVSRRDPALPNTTANNTTETFAYTYTPASRLISGHTVVGTGFAVERGYDPRREFLTSITTKWSGTARVAYAYQHTKLGQRKESTQSGTAFDDYGTDAVRADYTYDARGQLESARSFLTTGPTDPLPVSRPLGDRQFAFAYDDAGNRTTADRSSGGAAPEIATHNAANQLTRRQHLARYVSGTSPPEAQVKLAVDGVAPQRQDRYWWREFGRDGLASGAESGRSYLLAAFRVSDYKAALASRDLFFPKSDQTNALTYDADGNLESDEHWTYRWDAENRLVGMQSQPWTFWAGGAPGRKLEFKYDHLGRRVQKTVYTAVGGSETNFQLTSDLRFVYAGWHLVAELDAATNAVLRSYTWGLDAAGSLDATGGVGALLQIADHAADRVYHPAYDGNGNIAALIQGRALVAGLPSTDGAGVVAASYEYGPYGEALRAPPRTDGFAAPGIASLNPFRFSTKYTDAETGLVYYGMRFYDPAKGRFINRDPIEERGGLNLYGFCGGDGINRYDVLGMSWFSKLFKKLKKWIKKHSRELLAVLAIVAAFYVGPLVSNWVSTVITAKEIGITYAAASNLITGGVIELSKTAIITGAAAGGFAGGVVASSVQGGNLRQSLRSGLYAAGVATAFGSIAPKAFASGFNNPAADVGVAYSEGGVSQATAVVGTHVAHSAVTYGFQRAGMAAARSLNLSYGAFTAGLYGLSFGGEYLVGSRVYDGNVDPDSRSELPAWANGTDLKAIRGIFSRRTGPLGLSRLGTNVAGSLADVADIALNWQGLPTAAGLRYLQRFGSVPATGESNGAMDVANLRAMGLLDRGSIVKSLPFGSVGTSGLDGAINYGDFVSGFGASKLLNPWIGAQWNGWFTHMPWKNGNLQLSSTP